MSQNQSVKIGQGDPTAPILMQYYSLEDYEPNLPCYSCYTKWRIIDIIKVIGPMEVPSYSSYYMADNFHFIHDDYTFPSDYRNFKIIVTCPNCDTVTKEELLNEYMEQFFGNCTQEDAHNFWSLLQSR